MLGINHASAAQLAARVVHTLWTRAGVSLLAAGALASPCCDSTYVEDDCIEAITSDISCAGGIATGHLDLQIPEGEGCSPIVSAEFTSYNNRDGKPGFDPEGTDILVNTVSAENTSPTHNLTIGTFTTGDPTGTIKATHWSLKVGKPDGSFTTYSSRY